MAQSFVTTYKNHYRRPDLRPNPSAKPREIYDGIFPDDDIFFRPDSISVEKADSETVDKWIYDLYMKRYKTTYQHFFCQKLGKSSKKKSDDVVVNHRNSDKSLENELLEYCNNLYEPVSRVKIAPPLPGTRKIFGYVRPSRNYTPLTNYQFYIGKTAYNVLKGDYKWGADRLALQVPSANEESAAKAENKKGEKKNEDKKICCCSCGS